MTFATKLRAARLAANLTQQQLAHAVGCNNRTISMIETGQRDPVTRSVTFLQRLADVLGVEPGALVNEQGERDETEKPN